MNDKNITIHLDGKVLSSLEKRAKKELLDIDQLISDILRRSVLSYRGKSTITDNLDDKFLSYFTRKEKVDYLKIIKNRLKKKKSLPLYERIIK